MATEVTTNTTEHSKIPEMMWAQDENYIYLTIMASQSNSLTIDLQNQHFSFQTAKENYNFSFDWFEEIISEDSQYQWTGRCLFFTLRKKEVNEWTYLTKQHQEFKQWIKTDWTRWEQYNEDNSQSDVESWDEEEGDDSESESSEQPVFEEISTSEINDKLEIL